MATTILLTQVDWVILGAVGVSMAFGIWRGLAKELIALLTWVLAIVLSVVYAPDLMAHWASVIPNNELRTFLAWSTILLSVLVIGTLVKWLVGKMVAATPLKVLNHLLGGVFGVFRGVLLLSLLVFMAHLSYLPKQAWWQDSTTIPLLEKVTGYYYRFLPEEVKDFFLKYSDSLEPSVKGLKKEKVTEGREVAE